MTAGTWIQVWSQVLVAIICLSLHALLKLQWLLIVLRSKPDPVWLHCVYVLCWRGYPKSLQGTCPLPALQGQSLAVDWPTLMGWLGLPAFYNGNLRLWVPFESMGGCWCGLPRPLAWAPSLTALHSWSLHQVAGLTKGSMQVVALPGFVTGW